MISVEYSEAIVEVLDILNHSEDTIIEKIPQKLINFWQKNKSKTYKPNLDHSKPINEMNLKDKTKSIIAMIYIKYLCDDEKNTVKTILKDNEEKYQHELRKKYDIDNIFKNKVKEKKIINEIIEYKPQNFIKKLFIKIKNLFKRIKDKKE